jgi:hypothetical protein
LFRAWIGRTGFGRHTRSAFAAVDPNKHRLSMPYCQQKNDINRFLAGFDEYKREKKLA